MMLIPLELFLSKRVVTEGKILYEKKYYLQYGGKGIPFWDPGFATMVGN